VEDFEDLILSLENSVSIFILDLIFLHSKRAEAHAPALVSQLVEVTFVWGRPPGSSTLA